MTWRLAGRVFFLVGDCKVTMGRQFMGLSLYRDAKRDGVDRTLWRRRRRLRRPCCSSLEIRQFTGHVIGDCLSVCLSGRHAPYHPQTTRRASQPTHRRPCRCPIIGSPPCEKSPSANNFPAKISPARQPPGRDGFSPVNCLSWEDFSL